MKRTERLIALGEYLRGRRTGVTAEAMAAHFGVTVRTMYRDLDALRAAHVPLRAESGVGGGYVLERGYVMPPLNFSVEEALVLVTLVDWVRESQALPFGETLAGAAQRVRAALPPAAQRSLLTRQAMLSFVGAPARRASPAVRRAIESAWVGERVLCIDYEGRNGRSSRRIALRGVVSDGREVRLNATDLDLGEERQFLLHHIVSARLEEAPPPEVTRPPKPRPRPAPRRRSP